MSKTFTKRLGILRKKEGITHEWIGISHAISLAHGPVAHGA